MKSHRKGPVHDAKCSAKREVLANPAAAFHVTLLSVMLKPLYMKDVCDSLL